MWMDFSVVVNTDWRKFSANFQLRSLNCLNYVGLQWFEDIWSHFHEHKDREQSHKTNSISKICFRVTWNMQGQKWRYNLCRVWHIEVRSNPRCVICVRCATRKYFGREIYNVHKDILTQLILNIWWSKFSDVCGCVKWYHAPQIW